MALTSNRGLDRETVERRRTEALLSLGKGFVFKKTTKAEVWDTIRSDEDGIRMALRPFDLNFKSEDWGEDGYAYLLPLGDSEGGLGVLRVKSLSVLESYIFVILRRTYRDFAETGKMGRAVIKRADLDAELQRYADETTDWTSYKEKIDRALSKIARTKMIQIVNGKAITIHPIIAELVNGRWLEEFNEYLEQKKEEVYEREKVKKGPGKRDTIDEEEDALFDMTEEEE